MTTEKLAWHSLNRDLKVEQHEPVDFTEAMKILQRYLAHAGEKHDFGEDAIAATVFGFSRSRTDFIEISIDSADQFTYSFEMQVPDASWLRKLFGSVYQCTEKLHSVEELVGKIEEFFTMPAVEIKQRLQEKSRYPEA